jgi:hypothetical protein
MIRPDESVVPEWTLVDFDEQLGMFDRNKV